MGMFHKFPCPRVHCLQQSSIVSSMSKNNSDIKSVYSANVCSVHGLQMFLNCASEVVELPALGIKYYARRLTKSRPS